MTDIASDATAHHAQPDKVVFLRMPMVKRRTGLARATIYRLMALNEFPAQVKLAGRAVGWRESDIDRWAYSRLQTAH